MKDLSSFIGWGEGKGKGVWGIKWFPGESEGEGDSKEYHTPYVNSIVTQTTSSDLPSPPPQVPMVDLVAFCPLIPKTPLKAKTVCPL